MDPHRDLLISYTLLPWLNPARTRLLLATFEDTSEIRRTSTASLAALLNLSRERARVVRDPLQLPHVRQTVDEWRDRVIALGDADYPKLLTEIPDPPTALYVLGNRKLLSSKCLAIVGSRKSSRYGEAVAQLLSRTLARAGLTVVSGMARGIDAAAHDAALESDGATIAVLGTGIDITYPKSSTKLAAKILDRNGLFVSELPPGRPPRAANFPVRNRIISGLSLGVVIVEASERSGSLITARLAAEQDREVFAVPGSIFSPGSVGPHRLAQYGARLVHDTADILEELGLESGEQAVSATTEGPGSEVLAHLTPDEPMHLDSLGLATGIPPGRLTMLLLDLENAGLIEELPGGFYAMRP